MHAPLKVEFKTSKNQENALGLQTVKNFFPQAPS